VFSNNGLIDTDYPHGQVGPTAQLFSDPSRAVMSVSSDGGLWLAVSAHPITFDMPTNYFADLPADPSFNTQPGSQPADFSEPFTASLSDFNGRNWSSTLALLDGSAGGTWIDFSSTGLSEVNYVRFEVPAGANYRMVIDAVTAVPEPGVVVLSLAWTLGLLLRRR
jgi:hypothetical protein